MDDTPNIVIILPNDIYNYFRIKIKELYELYTF